MFPLIYLWHWFILLFAEWFFARISVLQNAPVVLRFHCLLWTDRDVIKLISNNYLLPFFPSPKTRKNFSTTEKKSDKNFFSAITYICTCHLMHTQPCVHWVGAIEIHEIGRLFWRCYKWIFSLYTIAVYIRINNILLALLCLEEILVLQTCQYNNSFTAFLSLRVFFWYIDKQRNSNLLR